MPQLVHDILENAAALTPDACAATLGAERVSFAQVLAQAQAFAAVLADMGVRHGDRVLVQAEFGLVQLGLFFGLQQIGAVFAPVHPAFGAEELAQAITYLRPALVVQDMARAAKAPVAPTQPQALIDGALLRDVIVAAGRKPAYVPVAEEDPHAIFLTSGSTGQPKGVVLSHRASWLRSHLGASRAIAAGGRGELLTFPMFHWAGWNYTLENWAHRRPVHYLSSTQGDDIIREINRHDPAYLYAIPAVWERILASEITCDGARLLSVGSGTSRFDTSLMERIKARFPNARRGIYYGSTEFGGACCQIDEEIARRPASVGQPYAGIAAKLVGGELALKGPTVFSGYFELPAKTAEVMQDGWYLTGDLADIDTEGFVTITGRAREVIRTGGEAVAPAEVELALQGFPGLRGVAIVGLADQVWGEIVCAVTELEPDAVCPDVAGLRHWLEGRVASYKHPRKVVVLSELPRTPATGQIMRTRIKEIVQAR